MKLYKVVTALLIMAFTLGTAWVPALAAPAAVSPDNAGTVRQIQPGNTVIPSATPLGNDSGPQANELAPSFGSDGSSPTHLNVNANFKGVNRSHSQPGSSDRAVQSGNEAGSNPTLDLSVAGLNHRDQRLANNGNQFSLEPPDQGLCAGNGFVLETVNDALRVFDAGGNALSGVIAQNTFYGYPPAIIRSTGFRGPFVTDPSCLFDQATQRWFHVVLTLDVDPSSGAFLGTNHLDLAVSTSADPTGSWVIYQIPAQDDGTQGTPNHNCSFGPCLGDYPHIGADANGFYIATNEYSFSGPEFIGAQIYAMSKQQLVAGGAVTLVQFNTAHSAPGDKPGFTVWPAQGVVSGGTEYFLSSTAADEAQCASGVVCTGTHASKNILLWSLKGTTSLNATPTMALVNRLVQVPTYAIPNKSNQKAGDFPLGQCINDTTSPIPCWEFLFAGEPAHDEVISHLDSNDTRMQQVTYANGLVWGALDTDAKVNGQHRAAIEYFAVATNGSLAAQGTLALSNNNLTYPAIGMLPNGNGVIAFTVVGDDHFPSAGYAGLSAAGGVGAVQIAAEGVGPADGFTSYKAYVGDPPRTRWGDYGAAAVDGNNIWIASEYIGQTCTLAAYMGGTFGSCSATRTALANWGTRISLVTP